MSRQFRIVTAVVAATAVLAAVPVVRASADPGTGSATAKAAYGSPTTVNPSAPAGSGLLGSTIAAVVQPLVDTLTRVVGSTVSNAVIGVLNASGNTADTTTGPSSYPVTPLPSIGVPGVLSLSLGGPSGSVTAGSSGYAANAQFTHAQLSVLGLSLADLGVATASASCPASGSPTASSTLTGLSLLNGLVTASLADGSSALTVDNNVIIGSTFLGLPIAGVTVSGNLLTVTLRLSLTDLLNTLGLGGLLGALSGVVDTSGTALNLKVTVGPGSSTAGGTQASAWGLEVGVDLSGTVSVGVLGLLGVLGGTAVVSIPSGISGTSYGNLLDLKLGYAACTSGPPTAITQWVPPGLI